MKIELTNARVQRANGNKRWTDEEKIINVAEKAGYKNIRREMGSAGNYIWVGDVNEWIKDGMFAVERK